MKKLSVLLTILIVLISCVSASGLTQNYNVGFLSNSFYIDENAEGKVEGFFADILNAVADEKSYEFNYIKYESANEMFEDLNNGTLDFALSSAAASSGNYNFIYTDSLYSSDLCMITDSETAAKVIATDSTAFMMGGLDAANGSFINYLTSAKNRVTFSRNNYMVLMGQTALLNALLEGRVDFAICDSEFAAKYFENSEYKNDYSIVYNYLGSINYRLYLQASKIKLRQDFNSGFSAIKALGTYSEITDRWIFETPEGIDIQQLRRIIAAIVFIGLALGVYAMMQSSYNKRLKKQVAEQTETLRDAMNLRTRILDASSSGMAIVDSKGVLSFANRSALRYLGLKPEEYVGKNVADLPIFGDFAKLMGLQLNGLSDNVARLNLNYKGKTRMYKCSVFPVRDAEDTVFTLMSIDDITADERRHQIELEAEKSRLLNTMVAGIAHEIKNPLTAIQTYTSLISEQKDNEEFMKALEESVPKETKRISRLIETLVGYARPPKLQKISVNISEMVSDVMTLVRPVAGNYHVDIEYNEGPEMYSALEPDLVRQAVLNYVMNALDAVHEKADNSSSDFEGKVRVSLSKEYNNAVIIIWDNGLGMTEEEMLRCTDPFYTTKAKGTGLGMSIALRSINRNNGTVAISSVKNEFTEIKISIPAEI